MKIGWEQYRVDLTNTGGELAAMSDSEKDIARRTDAKNSVLYVASDLSAREQKICILEGIISILDRQYQGGLSRWPGKTHELAVGLYEVLESVGFDFNRFLEQHFE